MNSVFKSISFRKSRMGKVNALLFFSTVELSHKRRIHEQKIFHLHLIIFFKKPNYYGA